MISAPSVIRKHGGRTALVLSKGRTLFGVIELTPRNLLLAKVTEADLLREGYTITNIDVLETAKRYLKHQAGVSENARQALQDLIDNAFLL